MGLEVSAVSPLSGTPDVLSAVGGVRSARPDSGENTAFAPDSRGESSSRASADQPARTNAEAFGQTALGGLFPGRDVQNFTSRLPPSAGSRSDSSPAAHSPGNETASSPEPDRDPATSSLAAAVLPGGPVQAQVPGADTRDLAGTQDAAQAASPASFALAQEQTQALEPVEASAQGEASRDQDAGTKAKARAAGAYARVAAGDSGARAANLAQVA